MSRSISHPVAAQNLPIAADACVAVIAFLSVIAPCFFVTSLLISAPFLPLVVAVPLTALKMVAAINFLPWALKLADRLRSDYEQGRTAPDLSIPVTIFRRSLAVIKGPIRYLVRAL